MTDSISGNQRFRVPFRVPVLLPSAAEPSMNFNNSQMTHFLSFVCVFKSKVPRHAFLGATKKKKDFCSGWRLVTESYSRDRGKQNGAILTIFSLIINYHLGLQVWERSFKPFVISRMFSAGVFIVALALIRACVWFCFNFVSLLPFLTFLFICRGGWGGKDQCLILYLLTDL